MIREHELAIGERAGEFTFGLESIPCIQQRSEVRIESTLSRAPNLPFKNCPTIVPNHDW